MTGKTHVIIELAVLIVLMVVTSIVLYVQYVGLQTTLDVMRDDRLTINASDDRGQGGASVATLVERDGDFVLICDIQRDTYQWPYCEVEIGINSDINGAPGIDFSQFTEVDVAAYYSPANARSNNATLRFQLRNYNPAYASLDDPDSLKFNGIEYRPQGKRTQISMDSINVYSWWIAANPDLPLALQNAEFDDTRFIELATGNYMRRGKHEIIISHITFTRPLLNSQLVNRALLYGWIVAIFALLMGRMLTIKAHLQRANRRESELGSVNRLLNVKKAELEQVAMRDPLTGALNRSGLESFFTSDTKQHKITVSCIFIDVDHFKQVNDNYGHAIGDAVLKALVTLISGCTRDTDLFARWGGEEFVLCCPNTQLAEAAMLAEKLRGAVAAHQWPANLTLTASFGVAQLNDESFTSLFERADQALYQAKAQGRNRVVLGYQ